MKITKGTIVILILAIGGLLAGCSGSETASSATSSTTAVASTTHATTTAPRTTASPTPVDTTAGDQRTCSAFEDQIIGTGLQQNLDLIIAGDPHANFGSVHADHFVPIPITLAGTSTLVNSAISQFNSAVTKFNAGPIAYDYGILRPVVDTYRAAVIACQGLIILKPAVYSVTCGSQTFATYEDAWSRAVGVGKYCTGVHVSGTQYSEQQTNAVTTAAIPNPSGMASLANLYGQCASTDANLVGPSVQLSSDSIKIYQGILILCPDLPQAAAIQARIDAAGAVAASSVAQSQAVTDGHYARVGTHLVGTDIQPGTWQSVGDRVTDWIS